MELFTPKFAEILSWHFDRYTETYRIETSGWIYDISPAQINHGKPRKGGYIKIRLNNKTREIRQVQFFTKAEMGKINKQAER
jgi:hypothetical protein